MKLQRTLKILGPGMLVAATGVGAGDLATASLAGSALGLTVLWAVLVGAFLKFVLNEGLTRWQLATGTTLLEGCVAKLGRPLAWLFLGYLVVWSFLVAAALMSAAGVTMHAILPLAGSDEAAVQRDKIVYGVLHSLAALILVNWGGYRLFERAMGVTIAVMFVTVVATAAAMQPPLGELLRGLFMPKIASGGAAWTVAIIGGVGGTVTVLCYGYWIREEGRGTLAELPTCRLDLVAGYTMTAVFGLAMVIVGSSLEPMPGSGARLVVKIADQLAATFGAAGPYMRWAFLAGAWGAVFSSILGVWQSVPYLFADLWQLLRNPRLEDARPPRVDTAAWPYRIYLYAIAIIPIVGLVAVNFQSMQKAYAIVGSLFIPMLAAVLIVLNGRTRWIGSSHGNSRWTSLLLAAAILLFAAAGVVEIRDTFFSAD